MFPYESVNQSIRIECSIRYLPVLGSITAFNLTWLRLDFEFDFSHLSSQRIRSLSNDDEDGNENVKTSSASRLFVNLILCRPCMTTTWNCQYSRLEFKSRRICQQLTNWTIWNKLDQVWSSVNSFLKLAFSEPWPSFLSFLMQETAYSTYSLIQLHSNIRVSVDSLASQFCRSVSFWEIFVWASCPSLPRPKLAQLVGPGAG